MTYVIELRQKGIVILVRKIILAPMFTQEYLIKKCISVSSSITDVKNECLKKLNSSSFYLTTLNWFLCLRKQNKFISIYIYTLCISYPLVLFWKLLQFIVIHRLNYVFYFMQFYSKIIFIIFYKSVLQVIPEFMNFMNLGYFQNS